MLVSLSIINSIFHQHQHFPPFPAFKMEFINLTLIKIMLRVVLRGINQAHRVFVYVKTDCRLIIPSRVVKS